MKLTRTEKKDDGIFGVLTQNDGTVVAVTLEHSYFCEAKIPNGVFTCVRGQHRLNGMTQNFTTFEIIGVHGHSNILFHWGNYNKDSEGCVLLGETRSGDMITNSKATFAKFIDLLNGINEFTLEVS